MKLVLIVGWLALISSIFLTADPAEKKMILPVRHEQEVQLKPVKGVWFSDDQPFTGTLINLSSQGDTLSISSYINGLEHGEWKTFYSRSNPREIRHYNMGKKTGKLIAWHENGQLSVRGNFVNGEYDGLLQEWNSHGNLLKALTYSNGYESGAQRAWYPNGKIRSNYTVVNGRRYGLLGTKNCINVSDSLKRSL